MENYGQIYLIKNKINNKKYIGQTKCIISGRKYGAKTRWQVHKYRALKNSNDCNIFYNSIRKYGVENFEMEILKTCELKDIDFLEKKYIEEYNTIFPNGYNIENGGKLNKQLNEKTKELLSKSKRYKYIKNKNDINKIENLLKEINIESLPKGIQYSHDSLNNIEGFCVIYGNRKKLFSSVNKTLKEKLNLAIEFYDLCKNNDNEGIKKFQENFENDYKNNSKAKRKYKYSEIENAMKELNIEHLPLYIRFEKRHNRFYVKKPNEKNICFSKNDPIKSLKEALDYIKAAVV